MVKKCDHCKGNGPSCNRDGSVTTEIPIPQHSDHSVSPDMKSDEVTRHTTTVTSLAADEEETTHCASLPHQMDIELEAKPVNCQMSAISNLMRHFCSKDRGGAKEEEGVDSYGASPPGHTNVQLKSDEDSRQTSATSGERQGEEEVEDFYGVNPLRMDGQVKFEQDDYGASTASNTSFDGVTQLVTPSTSSADDTEENLIDLYGDSPLLGTGNHFKYVASSHPTSQSFHIKHYSPKQTKASPAPHKFHHPPTITSTSTPSLPKHEIFLHTLPPPNASVPEVRAWIASWFVGREISFAIPCEGMDIGLQQYVDCISWSGDDVHNGWVGGLERDLRGWMLGAYAGPIVRDVERARDMEWVRRWKVRVGRLADFVWGMVFMGVVGLVLMGFMQCSCGD